MSEKRVPGAYTIQTMEAGVTGTKAFCRTIRAIVPGSSIVGEETLDNRDGDEHIDRLLGRAEVVQAI